MPEESFTLLRTFFNLELVSTVKTIFSAVSLIISQDESSYTAPRQTFTSLANLNLKVTSAWQQHLAKAFSRAASQSCPDPSAPLLVVSLLQPFNHDSLEVLYVRIRRIFPASSQRSPQQFIRFRHITYSSI